MGCTSLSLLLDIEVSIYMYVCMVGHMVYAWSYSNITYVHPRILLVIFIQAPHLIYRFWLTSFWTTWYPPYVNFLVNTIMNQPKINTLSSLSKETVWAALQSLFSIREPCSCRKFSSYKHMLAHTYSNTRFLCILSLSSASQSNVALVVSF